MSFDAEDLATFVDEDMPSHVTASHTSGDVEGLFGNGYGEAFGGLVGGTQPQLTVKTSEGIDIGDSLIINADSYLVISIEPDGAAGFTLIKLEKQ